MPGVAGGAPGSSADPPGTAWAKSPRTPSRLQKNMFQNFLTQRLFFGTSSGYIYGFLTCLLWLPFSKSLFSFSSSLLVSILSSQADPPTLKNFDFMKAGARFSKNQGL